MADQISKAMVRAGLSEEEAKKRVWLIDINGLVVDDMEDLPSYQQPYARSASEVADYERTHGKITLQTVVEQVKPTILIGTSTDHGAFTEDVIKALAAGCERPIVLPLSNPTSRIEVMPDKVIEWTDGKAFVAAGIPVDNYEYQGTTYTFGQGNNALLYPGLGLGIIVSGASKVTDAMIEAAAEAVAQQTDASQIGSPILPPVENLRASSATVAVAVVQQAIADGVATNQPTDIVQAVQDYMWLPEYS